MYKILYISYFAPYDKVDHAGGKVHNFYIKKLQKEKECDVTLLTMCYQRECVDLDLEEYGIKHRLVVLDRTIWQKYIRMFFSGFSYFNPWDKYGKILLNYERYQLKRMISRYAKEGGQPDLIVLQWTQIILLMPFVRKLYPDTKIIAIEEDVIFLNFFRRIGLAKSRWQKYIADFQYRNIRKKELADLDEAEQVVVNNFKDADLLIQNGIVKEKIFTSSVYFENYSFVNRNNSSIYSEKYRDILYYGAMHREENHISAVWFIKNVMPHLPENYRFVIVGARPRKELTALQNNRVKVVGFVEKIAPYFESCFCMAAPLLLGAGIKVKVLEAMSAGVPVMTNNIGIEGIGCRPDQEYLHCETSQDYGTAIAWMGQNPQQAEQMAAAGKQYIAENFDLEKKYEKLLITWNDLMGGKCR